MISLSDCWNSREMKLPTGNQRVTTEILSCVWKDSRNCFQLLPTEVDILLISLAPEISSRYQRFFAYLQDDKNQIRPSVDLVLRLLQVVFRTDYNRLEKYGLFADQAPLIQASLVYLEDETHRPGQPLMNRVVKVDGRIRDFLLSSDNMAREIADYASCRAPRLSLDDLLIKDEFKAHLLSLVRNMDFGQERIMLYLQGGYGAGKQAVAEGLCRFAGHNLLTVDLKSLIQLKPAEFTHKLSSLVREAELQAAALVFNDFDLLLPGQLEETNRSKENSSGQHDVLLHLLISTLGRTQWIGFFYWKCSVGTQGFTSQVFILSHTHTELGYTGKRAVMEVIPARVPAVCG